MVYGPPMPMQAIGFVLPLILPSSMPLRSFISAIFHISRYTPRSDKRAALSIYRIDEMPTTSSFHAHAQVLGFQYFLSPLRAMRKAPAQRMPPQGFPMAEESGRRQFRSPLAFIVAARDASAPYTILSPRLSPASPYLKVIPPSKPVAYRRWRRALTSFTLNSKKKRITQAAASAKKPYSTGQPTIFLE